MVLVSEDSCSAVKTWVIKHVGQSSPQRRSRFENALDQGGMGSLQYRKGWSKASSMSLPQLADKGFHLPYAQRSFQDLRE